MPKKATLTELKVKLPKNKLVAEIAHLYKTFTSVKELY
ncbi:MAG: hypothetical protein ACJA0H_001113 [Francisellaceae bacterium]|jgi:hypothetical protein